MARKRLHPIGFWSYTRRDDELAKGKLGDLRALIIEELEAQLGEQAPIFKDTVSIPHGTRWEQMTRKALANATFFIPILTPNFLMSEWCCREVRLFLEREQQLAASHPELAGRSRIFPIHYIDVAEADTRDEGVVETLMELQHLDFLELRYRGIDEAMVRSKVAAFVTSIRDLMRIRVEIPDDPPADEPPKGKRAGGGKPATVVPPPVTPPAATPPPPPPPSPPPPPPQPYVSPEPTGDLTAPAGATQPYGPGKKARILVIGLGIVLVLAIVIALATRRPQPTPSYGSSDYSGSNYASNQTNSTEEPMAEGSSTDGNAATNVTDSGATNGVVPVSSGRPIYVLNTCQRPLELRVIFEQNGAQFEQPVTNVPASGSIYLTHSATVPELFYHARTTDGSDMAFDGSFSRTFAGQSYPMRMLTADPNGSGDYVLTIPSCP